MRHFKCKECNFLSYNRAEIQEHKEKHKVDRPIHQCDICGFICDNSTGLIRHKRGRFCKNTHLQRRKRDRDKYVKPTKTSTLSFLIMVHIRFWIITKKYTLYVLITHCTFLTFNVSNDNCYLSNKLFKTNANTIAINWNKWNLMFTIDNYDNIM